MNLEITKDFFEVDLAKAYASPDLLLETNARFELTRKYKQIFSKKIKEDRGIGRKMATLRGTFKYQIELIDDAKLTLEGCPILCSLGGSIFSSESYFDVQGPGTIDLKLAFKPSAIKDCPDCLDKKRVYTLSFKLYIKDEQRNNSVLGEVDGNITIHVLPYTPYLKFDFKPEEGKQELFYSITEDKPQIKVGTLKVSHSADFSCAPIIEGAEFNLLTELDNSEKERKSGILTIKKGHGTNHQESATQGLIRELKPGVSIDFPVQWNMMQVNNPVGPGPLSYSIIIEYNDTIVRTGHAIILKKNPVLTRLQVLACIPEETGGNKEIDITNNNPEKELDLGTVSLIPGFESNPSITFKNLANARSTQYPDASVLVWGLQIKSIEATNNPKGLVFSDSKIAKEIEKLRESDEKEQLIHINKSLKRIISLRFPNANMWSLGPCKNASVEIIIPEKEIDAIKPEAEANETSVELELNIEYRAIEDRTGKYKKLFDKSVDELGHQLGDKGLCSRHFKIRLYREPQPEWLCVDFGTSAVVAAFANDINSRQNLIDLKKEKDSILKAAYPTDANKRMNDDEDRFLISSTVCLNNVVEEDSNINDFRWLGPDPAQYKNLTVWFSPSSGMVQRDYLLPCLKNMMGFEHLPNVFTDNKMNEFTYKIKGIETHLLEEGKETALMKVDEVFRIIYRQLFTFYLSQYYETQKDGSNGELKTRRIEKLVLSVPNTYNPLNLETLRMLARETMPGIYPEHLCLVSESDAVACYYLSHERKFLESLTDTDRREKLKESENVLVFDMGAGTLDLTLFSKIENPETREKTITIKGKMGVNKAGNYLDYVLAEIIEELCKKNGIESATPNYLKKLLILDKVAAEGQLSRIYDRNAFKDYVKDLKKLLSQDENEPLPPLKLGEEEYNLSQLKIKDILGHSKFKDFIKEITHDILKRFIDLFGEGSENDKKIDLDIFIFSGRSTSLKAIRDGVFNNIDDICKPPEKLLFADINSGKLSPNINFIEQGNSKLKTVVTLGALAYASMYNREGSGYHFKNEPYYATFGVVAHINDGTYKWIPLIGKGIAVSGEDGRDGKVSNSKEIDFGPIIQLDLIQSYSADVIQDYKDNNFDMISKLAKVTRAKWPSRTLNVTLEMFDQSKSRNNTMLKFQVGANWVHLNPHDDFDNESLRKSFWPVIF